MEIMNRKWGKIVLYQGVILAGGHSKRFGSPKAFAEKDGFPFYIYSIKALEKHCQSLVLVTNPHLKSEFDKALVNQSIDIVNDEPEFQGQGPLSGIYTAMKNYPAEWYFVSPIDVPFISAKVYELLLDHVSNKYDVIIPIVKEKLQPLLAIYHHSLQGSIKRSLQMQQNSIQEFLVDKRIKYVFIECDQFFININSLEDYRTYIQG